jgi:hypothetical protein
MKLSFSNIKEFEDLFKTPNLDVANGIVDGIQKSHVKKKKTALLFEFSFEGDEYEYSISLPKDQWEVALKACLKKYEEAELFDQAIDTYQLIQKVTA